MKPIKLFFYWMSKTDEDIIDCPNMPKIAQHTQIALGIFVFMTMILAFFSGQELARTFFYEYDGNEIYISFNGMFISFFFGILWACIVGMIDREIVSNQNKIVNLLRVPLAIVIALSVSVPLELKALKNDIEQHLLQQNRDDNLDIINRKNESLERLDADLVRLKNRIDLERQEISKWSRIMDEERAGLKILGRSGQSGIGPRYKEAVRNLTLHEKLKKEYQAEYDAAKLELDKERERIIDHFKLNYNLGSYGLTARYEALSEMKKKSIAVKEIAIGLMLLILIVELTPALIKMMSKKSTYDHLMAARSVINEQVINSQTNQFVGQVNGNPALANNAVQMFGQMKLAITK